MASPEIQTAASVAAGTAGVSVGTWDGNLILTVISVAAICISLIIQWKSYRLQARKNKDKNADG